MSSKNDDLNKKFELNKDEEENEKLFEILRAFEIQLRQAATEEEKKEIEKQIQTYTEGLDVNSLMTILNRYSDSAKNYEFTSGGNMPVVPVRGTVFFPEAIVHFDISRKEIKEDIGIAAETEANSTITASRVIECFNSIVEFIQNIGLVIGVLAAAVIVILSIVNIKRQANKFTEEQLSGLKSNGKYIPGIFVELNESKEILRYFLYRKKWKHSTDTTNRSVPAFILSY